MSFDINYDCEKILEYFNEPSDNFIGLAQTAEKIISVKFKSILTELISEIIKCDDEIEGYQYHVEIIERILFNLNELLKKYYPERKLDARIQILQLQQQFIKLEEFLEE